MIAWRAAAASVLTLALVAVPGSAQAERVTLADPPGDTRRAGLDITSATFANRDRAVVATLTFERDRPGAVFIGVKGRHGRVVAVVRSLHRQQGPDKVSLVERERPCRALSSSWNRATATITVRLPSRCVVREGDYGALRFAAATTLLRDAGESLVDYVPRGLRDEPFSRFVARG
jgi:hypothetical protein